MAPATAAPANEEPMAFIPTPPAAALEVLPLLAALPLLVVDWAEATETKAAETKAKVVENFIVEFVCELGKSCKYEFYRDLLIAKDIIQNVIVDTKVYYQENWLVAGRQEENSRTKLLPYILVQTPMLLLTIRLSGHKRAKKKK